MNFKLKDRYNKQEKKVDLPSIIQDKFGQVSEPGTLEGIQEQQNNTLEFIADLVNLLADKGLITSAEIKHLLVTPTWRSEFID